MVVKEKRGQRVRVKGGGGGRGTSKKPPSVWGRGFSIGIGCICIVFLQDQGQDDGGRPPGSSSSLDSMRCGSGGEGKVKLFFFAIRAAHRKERGCERAAACSHLRHLLR